MTDAFSRDRRRRREWWDGHLWLQLAIIAVLCIVVGLVEHLDLAVLLVGTGVFLVVVSVLTRVMVRSRRRT
jgi:uncharacterized membrane protein YhaH (DUF805 family)